MTPVRDIPEAAEALGVLESWLRKQVTARKVPFSKLGKHVRFTEEHLLQILAANERQPRGAVTRSEAAIRKVRAARAA